MEAIPEGMPPKSFSTPALPPLVGASASRTMPTRQTFLSGLLNEDLQNLAKWHGNRPHHEQKRFLRSVSTLYKAFTGGEDSANKSQASKARAMDMAQEREREAAATAAATAAAIAHAEEDPLNGPPRSPRAMAVSASDPCLSKSRKPIEVFEQKKRRGLRGRGQDDEDPNTLSQWLEGRSVSSATTGTTSYSQQSRFSQLTATSNGSLALCSDPGTTNQAHYRKHKRAMAANKNKTFGNPQTQGNLKDGIPTMGFPDSERMTTAFKDFYGSRPAGENITKGMYASVIQGEYQPFVAGFLDSAPPEQRAQFADMARSLEYLRRTHAHGTTSLAAQDYDLHENQRLWKPPKQKPVFEASQRNLSKVPIGSAGMVEGKKGPPSLPQIEEHVPPSPTVSGLGSLPLSRLSTPLVA